MRQGPTPAGKPEKVTLRLLSVVHCSLPAGETENVVVLGEVKERQGGGVEGHSYGSTPKFCSV